MGELNLDRIERPVRPASGYMAAMALLAEYDFNPRPDKLHELLKELKECAADDSCQSCVHQVECSRIYDVLASRIR